MSADPPKVVLGRISGAHGIRGEVRVKPFTERPEAVGDYGPVTAVPGGRKLRLKVLRVVKDGVIARIDGVTDRNAAEELKGLTLEVERAVLPEADEGEFYQADLIGLSVEDKAGRRLGTVRAVNNYGGGDILEIAPDAGGPTVLMSFTRETVPVVDLEGQRLVADPPAGVFDEEQSDGDGEE
jgi:16S rRNA processing protein RimM